MVAARSRQRTGRAAMRGDNAKECRLQAKYSPLQSSRNIMEGEEVRLWKPEEVRKLWNADPRTACCSSTELNAVVFACTAAVLRCDVIIL